MIASMTGFARREASGPWGSLVCELRSVNHRFLEPGLRLPDELRGAEGELRARLARQLRRGKVDCTMSYRRPSGAESAIEVLRWPGVLREESGGAEQVLVAAYALFDATLAELAAARSREGARLAE